MCCYCNRELGSIHYGAGGGDGQQFACYSCWKLKEATDVLTELEWHEDMEFGAEATYCIVCGSDKHEGHRDDCRLHLAITSFPPFVLRRKEA